MLAVAEVGSFHKASVLPSVGQSAITRHVQKLEDAKAGGCAWCVVVRTMCYRCSSDTGWFGIRFACPGNRLGLACRNRCRPCRWHGRRWHARRAITFDLGPSQGGMVSRQRNRQDRPYARRRKHQGHRVVRPGQGCPPSAPRDRLPTSRSASCPASDRHRSRATTRHARRQSTPRHRRLPRGW